jgi:P4 family phage/plasmid primase-like protien
MLYDPDFMNKLDENIYLLGFENGVYDLENLYFRDGCPDDYITKSVGYDYIEYDEEDEHVMAIEDFLKKIQPVKKLRRYLKLLLSTCLSGSVADESFYIFTGSGANGKSKLVELMKHTLGPLYAPMDIKELTEKRGNAGAASPGIANKKGVRMVTLDEPKATDVINSAFMKLIVGGDTLETRMLHKNPITMKPQFKAFLLCNVKPGIDGDDEGTWRRIKVLEYLSKFLREENVTPDMKINGLPDNHHMADLGMSDKIPDWRQSMMALLIENYKILKTEEGGVLKHPPVVMEATNEYRKKCDVYQDFVNDCLERTSDRDAPGVTLTAMYSSLTSWIRKNYTIKCPTKKDLRNYLSKRLSGFSVETDKLMGYTFKQCGEDVSDALDHA